MLNRNHTYVHSDSPNTTPFRTASRLPQHIWDSLTEFQKTAIQAAIADQTTNHIAKLRSSFRVAGRRYYVAAFFGHERRSVERLRRDGQLDQTEVSFVLIILGFLMLIFGAMFVALFAYAIKSLIGIDIIDGPSPLHAIICR